MADLDISWDGNNEIIGMFDALPAKQKQAIMEMLAEAGQRTFDGSQADVPVDTGELKDSGFIRVNDEYVEVGYGTDHCWYVELGTVKMAAQPYLAPNFGEQAENVIDQLKGL